MKEKIAILAALILSAAGIIGCSTLAKKLSTKDETGVVVARTARIRSSTAVVAADLVEVNRGEQVTILDSVDVVDPQDNSRKERWLRVRANKEEATEGWIEARNIMPQDVLDRSNKLAEADKNIQTQATGQLRASSNLRLEPDRSGNDNIIMRLDSGSSFEIMGWKRVPKPKTSETIESDVAPKAGSAQPAAKGSKNKDSDEDREPEETNELWYRVRLPPSFSPAPAGWIYGKQVELTVPPDIIFYRTGREFVAWHRLDGDLSDTEAQNKTQAKNKDAAREARPGSWVILEKSSSDQPHTLDEPDFDRIYVLGYDKRDQDHYTAFRSPDVKGYLPIKVEGSGDDKSFTVRIQDDGGQVREVQYSLSRDNRGYLRVNAPAVGLPRRRR